MATPASAEALEGRHPATERRWRYALRFALLLYCVWGGLLILQNPGFQYDEALLVLGSVHMRHSAAELTLPHDPDTWVCPFGRCIPLMTVRYVGAIKEYLCLPVFAAFGPSAEAVRLVSMLLGALGVWGFAKLVSEQAGAAAGAATAVVIAMNPAYVDLTVFDNGTVSIWMGAMGILALAVSHYLRRTSARSAFWLGIAMGLGVWARANFVWLLVAMFAATLIVLRSRIVRPVSHWVAAAGGAVVGGFPFLAYQVISKGGTWQALSMFASQDSLGQRIYSRLEIFAETLLSDQEHRAIWNGPPMPEWQRWFFPAVGLIGLAVCLTSKSAWTRIMALGFLFLGAFLLLSTAPVAEHHLIALAPLAAAICVLGWQRIAAWRRWGRIAAMGVAAVYLGCSIYWQVAAIQGLQSTGGVGQWSDAVYSLSEFLEQKYPGREIKILDWGLQNNLYVVSDGRIRSREIYGLVSSREVLRWVYEMQSGGIFLMNGPTNRQSPAASTGFLREFDRARPKSKRFTVPQQNGIPYAEIFEIEPNSVQNPWNQ